MNKNWAVVACAAYFCVGAWAAPMLVDTHEFLADPGFNVLDLKEDGGRTIGRLDRPGVQRLVDVTTRIGAVFGMHAPETVIALNNTPTASADWHDGHLRVEMTPAMLSLAGGNDDMLAAVVAHAMAHVQASHLTADFSQQQEMEADRLALRAMADSGFHPQGAAAFWQMIRQHPKAWWNDSHPDYPQRDQVIAAAVAAAGPVAAAAGTQPASDPKSLGLLAMNYATGQGGVPKDYGKARTFAERAAQGGDLQGLALLGALMRDGIAGFADPERGTSYLEKAAQGGNSWAHYQLGISFERGLGVAPDRAKALAQYAAAAHDIPEAARRAAELSK